MTEPLIVVIAGNSYRCAIPLSIGDGLALADAMTQFGDLQAKISLREPGIAANRLKMAGVASAIVSRSLIRTNPEVTPQFIRDNVSSGSDEVAGLIAAASSILISSGYFTDEQVKAFDASLKAAAPGEAQPETAQAA